MATPERNLWLRLKDNLPKGTHHTRIENRAGSGIPDVLIAHSGAFFVELKCIKGHKITLRPSQIAWNTSFSRGGGISFILVNRPSTRDLFLFDAGDAIHISGTSIQDSSPLWQGKDMKACALRLIDLASELQARIPGTR